MNLIDLQRNLIRLLPKEKFVFKTARFVEISSPNLARNWCMVLRKLIIVVTLIDLQGDHTCNSWKIHGVITIKENSHSKNLALKQIRLVAFYSPNLERNWCRILRKLIKILNLIDLQKGHICILWSNVGLLLKKIHIRKFDFPNLARN